MPRALANTKKSESEAIQLNIVSALNDLDINVTSLDKATYEMTFRDRQDPKHVSANASFITMAYLIAENANREANGALFTLSRVDQLRTVAELLRIDELRNGLYALKVTRRYFEAVKAVNSLSATRQGLDCLLELQLTNQV